MKQNSDAFDELVGIKNVSTIDNLKQKNLVNLDDQINQMINFESHKRRKLKKGSSLANSQGLKSLNNSNSNSNLLVSPSRPGKASALHNSVMNNSSMHLDVHEAKAFDESSV